MLVLFCFYVIHQNPINGYLLYIDSNNSRYQNSDSHTFEDFILPYMVYYDQKNKPVEIFFDTFVLIDLTFYNTSYTTTKYWWYDFINRLFKPKYQRSPFVVEPGYNSKKAACLNVKESCIYFNLSKTQYLTLSFYAKNEGKNIKAGYMGFKSYPTNSEQSYTDNGFIWSEYLGIWYKYLNVDSIWQKYTYEIQIKPPFDSVTLYLGKWLSSSLFLDSIEIATSNRKVISGFEHNDKKWYFKMSPIIDDITMSDYVFCLDTLAEKCSRLIETGDMKLDVVITIPWSHLSSNSHFFGVIKGKNIDLSKKDDANIAVKWYIDACIQRWSRAKPKHLNLLGFYWLNEEGHDFKVVDLKEIASYIHKKGYIVLGSSYNKFWMKPSLDINYFKTFDCIFMQPNIWPVNYKENNQFYEYAQKSFAMGGLTKDTSYIKENGIPADEFAEIQQQADSLNAGVVIEWVPGQENIMNYGRVLDYCNNNRKLKHNYLGKNILIFDNGGFGQFCYRSENPIFRRQYDEVYKFVKLNR
ncbi:MAG: DUF4855 domain-containing protein [bacterium]